MRVSHSIRSVLPTAVLVGLAFFLPDAAARTELVAKVVGVTDGDTITLLTESQKQLRVRLAEIDAPEKSQPWGKHAKEDLSQLVFGKTVTISTFGTDQYGRTLARVHFGTVYVNAELIRCGDALAYVNYLTDYTLVSLQAQARQQHIGLWSLPTNDQIAPWDWRRGLRSRTQHKEFNGSNFQCSGKHYCRQMTSCAEAEFYLHTCAINSLDGDHDGTPCETLCR